MSRNFKLWGSLGTIILISLMFSMPVLALEQRIEFNLNRDAGNAFGLPGQQPWVQTFTIGTTGINQNYNMTKLALQRWSAGPGDVTSFLIGIKATSGGVPTGADLCNITGQTSPANVNDWKNYTFPKGCMLSPSTQYAINLSTGQTAYTYFSTDGTNSYLDGQGSGTGLANDLTFIIYGNSLIDLNSPVNNYLSIKTINFNCSSVNSDNITLYIGNIFNQTQIGKELDAQINFSSGNYNWTCQSRDSLNNLAITSTRFFSILSLAENNQTFNAQAYETAIEPFSINYTFDPTVVNMESLLNYAGVNYSTNKFIYGNNVIFSTSIAMPLITSGTTNTFYWITTIYNATTSYQSISSSNTQTLNRIYLAKCNATYTVSTLNFTAYSENNSLQINPFQVVSAFNYWLGNGNTYRTLSYSGSGLAMDFCIYPQNRTFYSTATLEYSASGYLARDYYLSNATLTNVTNNISLYLLDTASATSFIEEVLDTGRNPVENAIIYIQRCYGFSCNTVQMAKTDVNGRTIGFYKTEIVDYQHIIIKDGVVIYTDSPHKIFGLSVPYTNQFFVGNASVLNFNPNGIANLYSTLVYNNDTNVVTYLYIDTSGLFQNGRLFVDFWNMSGTNPVICNVTSFSSSASLTCDLNTYPEGSYEAVGYITRAIEQTANYITFITSNLGNMFGNYGLFLGMMIIITAGMAFLYHPIAGTWSVTLAIIFTNIIGLTKFTGIWIFGTIFLAILFTWLFKD